MLDDLFLIILGTLLQLVRDSPRVSLDILFLATVTLC